jgi:4-amino-4-deoxy-L-arabinose transferase-like glycosyltransferase
MSNPSTPETRNLYRVAMGIVIALTLLRIVVLILGRLELYPDEGQYWWWARTPDWGYFSKPPMIAWIMWVTTGLFGDGEWAIRLASPLLHGATALLLYAIGRRLYDVRTAFWSAVVYVTLPGVTFSSDLVSTDVPLLFFWALTLLAFLRALDDRSWRWVVLCGVGLGAGLLSKYAMLYFVLGAVAAALLVPKVRALVFSARGAVILAIALVLFSPNVIWNATHGFPTVEHTEANADWDHAHYKLMNILTFLGGQVIVFGPFAMAVLLWLLWRLWRGPVRDERALILAAFVVPPLALITAQAFIAEANANWAATAYIAATPWVVNEMLRLWRARPLSASLAFNLISMLALWVIMIDPPIADRIGVGNAFKRMEGWHELGQAIVEESHRAPYSAIVLANRSVMAELIYYARDRSIPLRMWDKDTHDDNHFEMTMRLAPGPERDLLAISPEEDDLVLPSFRSVTPIRTIVIPVGGHHQRIIALYDVRSYRGPQPHVTH